MLFRNLLDMMKPDSKGLQFSLSADCLKLSFLAQSVQHRHLVSLYKQEGML